MQKNRTAPSQRPLKTLERVFSKAGLGSRTDARSWIGNGRVRVNGKIVRNPDHWVDLAADRVTLDGKPLRQSSRTYIILYKPKGYITTWRDPDGRPTVYDLLGEMDAWLSPVGTTILVTRALIMWLLPQFEQVSSNTGKTLASSRENRRWASSLTAWYALFAGRSIFSA